MPDYPIAELLESTRLEVESPGLAAGLLYADGRREYAACGIARTDTGLPLHHGMTFPAGSVIKPCIGSIAHVLAARGALSLDDPLRQWVPEFSGSGDLRSGTPEAAANPAITPPSDATLRQVLCHSAGIKCFTELLYWLPYELQVRNAQRQWGDADALAVANGFPPYFAPGTGFHYSNCGYVLLGLALERAASAAEGRKVTLLKLLMRHVFTPLKMRSTGYIRYAPPLPNTQARRGGKRSALELRGYMQPEQGGHDVTAYETYGLYGPAGALLSSLPDLLTLSAGLFGHTASGGGILPPADALLADAIPAGGPGRFYGLGVQVFERDWAGGRFIGHGGNVMGVSSGMWYFPERGLHLAFVANRALVRERPIFEAMLSWADSE